MEAVKYYECTVWEVSGIVTGNTFRVMSPQHWWVAGHTQLALPPIGLSSGLLYYFSTIWTSQASSCWCPGLPAAFFTSSSWASSFSVSPALLVHWYPGFFLPSPCHYLLSTLWAAIIRVSWWQHETAQGQVTPLEGLSTSQHQEWKSRQLGERTQIECIRMEKGSTTRQFK